MFGTVSTSIKNRSQSIIYFSGLASLLALSACGDNSGPCEWYPQEQVRMDVVKIEPLDDAGEQFEVWLEFNKSILGKENQKLSELRGHDITREFLELNHITTDITFIGNVTELKSGDCEPYYLSFDSGFITP
jgi:hypothetical protein